MQKLTVPVLTAALLFAIVPRASAAVCTNTGFIRDGIDLTAALINPATVPTPLDATGCDIGVYYDHNQAGGVVTLNGVDVGGARYFGVAVNGDAGPLAIHLTNNLIHNIGNLPFDGTQHGVGIYVRAYFNFNITGELVGNTVSAYQKGGIVLTGGGVRLTRVDNNRVYGLGRVNFIAQNGIQVSYGALPYPSQLLGNIIVGNSYSGTGDGSSSAGILVIGGPGFGLCPNGDPCPYEKTVLIGVNTALNQIGSNFLFNNDVGVWLSNVAEDGISAPPVPTNNFILATVAGDDQAYNVAYQAGISDFGNTDFILVNYIIQGGGYGTPCTSNIDITGSVNPQVAGNTPAVCAPPSQASAAKVKRPSPSAQ